MEQRLSANRMRKTCSHSTPAWRFLCRRTAPPWRSLYPKIAPIFGGGRLLLKTKPAST